MSGKDPILVRREGNHLVPINAWSSEQLQSLPENVDLNARVTRASPKESRRHGTNAMYWAGLGLMVENFDEEDEKAWPTSRKLHNLIAEELGYTTKIYRIDRSYRLEVDSVAFDAMTDDEFEVFVEKARAWMVAHFGWDPVQAWIDNKEAQG